MPLTTARGTHPGDALPPPPQRAMPARNRARCGAAAGSPRPHHRRPRNTGNGTWLPTSRTGGRERERAEQQTPLTTLRSPPPPPQGDPPPPKAARNSLHGTHTKGTVLSPHARTAPPTARRQQIPTACPKDRQPGDDECLTSDTPENSASNPLRGCTPQTPERATPARQSAR